MTITRKLRFFLENLVYSTQSNIRLSYATMAIKILERGIITENKLSRLKMIGYKE